MNLREGTRRLALLLGLVGAILCGVLSYAQLQSTLRQRADHKRFELLASSSVVKQARRECFASPPETLPGDFFDKNPPLPKGAELMPPFCYTPDYDKNEFDYTPSESNNGGIKTVHFERQEIASIETQDGQTLYPTPAPGAWSYALIAILPLLGFVIPCGAVRAIGWVGAGFVQPSK